MTETRGSLSLRSYESDEEKNVHSVHAKQEEDPFGNGTRTRGKKNKTENDVHDGNDNEWTEALT